MVPNYHQTALEVLSVDLAVEVAVWAFFFDITF